MIDSASPSLEQQMDDLNAALDAAEFRRTPLQGTGAVARMMALFAATYPERVSSLILTGPAAAGSDGLSSELVAQLGDILENSWGRARVSGYTRRASLMTRRGSGGARALSECQRAR